MEMRFVFGPVERLYKHPEVQAAELHPVLTIAVQPDFSRLPVPLQLSYQIKACMFAVQQFVWKY